MLVVCAGKALKQPIEIDIPEDEYEKIKKMESPSAQNAAIADWAIKHVKKYGYDLGTCSSRKQNVDLKECLACGERRGLKKNEWEICKSGNITYKYPTSKTTLNAIRPIKDEKINKKLELTSEELAQAKNLYITDK